MKSSPTITKIAPALIKFKSLIYNVDKEAIANIPNRSYKWAKLEGIIAAINDHLIACDLTILQPPMKKDSNVIETYVLHSSGEWIGGDIDINHDWIAKSAQDVGIWITYMRRYSVLAVLGMGQQDDPTDDDAVGHAAEANEPINKDQKEQILRLMASLPEELRLETMRKVLSYNKVKDLDSLTQAQLPGVMRSIKGQLK